jgi:predicted Zn-dependent protease
MHKKGEKIVIASGESVFIESPGYIGLLVLNDGGDSSTKKIDLKPADEWLGPTYQRKLNRSLNELITDMNEAQVLLSSRKAAEALSKVLRLEKKFPDLVELELLEASCQLVLGDRSKAVTVLTGALREDPTNEAGLALYRSLVGDEAANRLPATLNNAEGQRSNPGKPK